MLYHDPLSDELAPNARSSPQVFHEVGAQRGQAANGSTKVGWTLRNKRGRIAKAFAFRINPQGLTRTDGSRAQLTATRGGLFVDAFGPGATTIQLRQVIASGKVATGAFFTAREDVQRFMENIYLPATASDSRYKVYFHDSHLERGMEELVYFPPQSHVLTRSVEHHNVWKLDLLMIGLEKYPYTEVRAEAIDRSGGQNQRSAPYTVRSRETVQVVARKIVGADASGDRVDEVRRLILDLNPAVAGGDGGRRPGELSVGETIRIPV